MSLDAKTQTCKYSEFLNCSGAYQWAQFVTQMGMMAIPVHPDDATLPHGCPCNPNMCPRYVKFIKSEKQY